jgi:hypothetical protein
MNGPEVREVYYNPDGTADWLKSIVRTCCVYWDPEGKDAWGPVVHVSSIAANRALMLYYKKTDTIGGLYG